MLSDHYHPWIAEQGQSPFVWSVIGSIAQATERLRVGTGVTCPLIRMHPAIVAQVPRLWPRCCQDALCLVWGQGEPQRTHPRRLLAAGGDTTCYAGRGRGAHPAPLAGACGAIKANTILSRTPNCIPCRSCSPQSDRSRAGRARPIWSAVSETA